MPPSDLCIAPGLAVLFPELGELRTHDSAFTRGFDVGYVVARSEAREPFGCEVLERHLGLICELLLDQGARVTKGTRRRSTFGACFVQIEVAWG